MSFETTIGQVDEQTLEGIFGTEAPLETTPSVKNLEGTTLDDDGVVHATQGGTDEIPFLEDVDAILDEKEPAKTPEELKVIADAEAAKAKENEGLTPEEITAKEEKVKADAEVEKLKAEKDKADEVDPAQVSSVLKGTVDYLIKQGFWEDFEGREDLEITEEIYADLAAKQNQHAAMETFNELIDSTGDYGKAIISHIKNGGNPDEIIDLFKEQKALETIDTTTELGKQEKIEKYYKEVLGFKPEKVSKMVKRLVEDNEIESEFADVEEQYTKHYQEKLAETQKATQERERVAKEKQQTFVSTIKSALDEDTTLSPQEKKVVASGILDFKHKLDNGQKVNDFYLKFAEMQKDPKQYIELVRFVMDPINYKKHIEVVAQSTADRKAFNFIKGNSTVKTGKGSTIEINEKRD